MQLDIRQIKKVFRHNGLTSTILQDVSLSVAQGEFVVVVGPSGCGKTTLLRIIAGLLPSDGGRVVMTPQLSAGLVPIVWQEHRLYPWRTVYDNIRLGMEIGGWPLNKQHQRTMSLLQLVALENFASHYPYQLSGGMSQRVALARALAVEPSLLLMDEPFSSTDYLTRRRIQAEVKAILNRLNISTLFVTHDIDEAVRLADRVVVLSSAPSVVLGECVPKTVNERETAKQKILSWLADSADYPRQSTGL